MKNAILACGVVLSLVGASCVKEPEPNAPSDAGHVRDLPRARIIGGDAGLDTAVGEVADAVSDVNASTDAGDGGPAPAEAGLADAMVNLPDDLPRPPPRPTTQCSNGEDDDGDGRYDLEDGDCASERDPTESGDRAPTACNNGVDDDGDGVVDFPDELGCAASGDGDEADPPTPPACGNAADDDEDGRVDFPLDPGCAGLGDADESDPPVAPVCGNGLDDDEDGQVDFPADDGCDSAADQNEDRPGGCGGSHQIIDLNAALRGADFYEGNLNDGVEGFVGTCGGNAGPEVVFAYRINALVGAVEFSTEHAETELPTVVYVRTTCDDPRDVGCNRGAEMAPGTHVRVENPELGVYYVVVDTSLREQAGRFRLSVHQVEAPRCSDRRDNDQDGRLDLLDPGCVDEADEDEGDPATPPECGDGIDNDGDMQIDYPNDDTCHAAGGDVEADAACALAPNLLIVGPEGGLVQVNTLGLADNYQASCGGGGPEQVIAVVVDRPATVIADCVGNNYDTLMFARRVCDDAASEIGCNDDFVGVASHIEFLADVPGPYYIFVDGFAGSSGLTGVNIVVQ